MQKWEYLEMEVEIGGPLTGKKGRAWSYQANGKHVTIEGEPGALMAKLGDEGWELIASSARIITGLSANHKINHIFKRPKPEK